MIFNTADIEYIIIHYRGKFIAARNNSICIEIQDLH